RRVRGGAKPRAYAARRPHPRPHTAPTGLLPIYSASGSWSSVTHVAGSPAHSR
ncbi:hypothetical protein GA0115257_109418, partial [Streptomyces sp. LcepLS]